MSHDFPDGPDYNPEPIDDDPWDVDTDTQGDETMTASEIEKIVAETLNILESDYDLEGIENLGMPTVQEIAARIRKDLSDAL